MSEPAVRSGIEAIDLLVEKRGFNPQILVGRKLADRSTLKVGDEIYIAGTEVVGKIAGFNKNVPVGNTIWTNLIETDFSATLNPSALPEIFRNTSRLLLRRTDDAVVGIALAGDKSGRMQFAIPVSNRSDIPVMRSYLEPNPEHKSDPTRPRFRYGEPTPDVEGRRLTGIILSL